MAEWAVSKIVSILLIVVVVIVILLASTGKLYAVIKPILGLDIGLHEQSEDALSKVYDLYRECKESANVDCTCLGKERIEINEGDRIVVSESDLGEGIKMSLNDIETEIKFRLLGGVNHCNFPRAETVDRKEAAVTVKLYTVNNELKVEGSELLGYTPNPILLYKTKKDDKIAICMITSDVFVQQLPKKACF